MRILLDTHIFIWMATEPERLSPQLTELFDLYDIDRFH
jgi:PIN domain nuclease of toxin-antitoxin system